VRIDANRACRGIALTSRLDDVGKSTLAVDGFLVRRRRGWRNSGIAICIYNTRVPGNADDAIGYGDVLADAEFRTGAKGFLRLEHDVSVFVEKCAGEAPKLVIPVAGFPVEGVFDVEVPALGSLRSGVGTRRNHWRYSLSNQRTVDAVLPTRSTSPTAALPPVASILFGSARRRRGFFLVITEYGLEGADAEGWALLARDCEGDWADGHGILVR